MRPSLRLIIPATFSIVLGLGCADQQAPMAPTDQSTSSSRAERTTAHFGFGFDNGERLVILGGALENWVNFCRTGEENWDALEIFTVTRPDGSTKATWKSLNQDALVWDLPADPCTDTPDHVGIVRTVLTDSDVDLSGQGADAAQLHVVGTVTNQRGQLYHFVLINQSVVAPEFTSTDDFEFRHENIKIKLTPIAG